MTLRSTVWLLTLGVASTNKSAWRPLHVNNGTSRQLDAPPCCHAASRLLIMTATPVEGFCGAGLSAESSRLKGSIMAAALLTLRISWLWLIVVPCPQPIWTPSISTHAQVRIVVDNSTPTYLLRVRHALPLVRSKGFDAIWFLDVGVRLASLDLLSFHARWACAIHGRHPLVAQPALTNSSQWTLSWQAWGALTGPLPLIAEADSASMRALVVDAAFWVWFMDTVGTTLASVQSYITMDMKDPWHLEARTLCGLATHLAPQRPACVLFPMPLEIDEEPFERITSHRLRANVHKHFARVASWWKYTGHFVAAGQGLTTWPILNIEKVAPSVTKSEAFIHNMQRKPSLAMSNDSAHNAISYRHVGTCADSSARKPMHPISFVFHRSSHEPKVIQRHFGPGSVEPCCASRIRSLLLATVTSSKPATIQRVMRNVIAAHRAASASGGRVAMFSYLFVAYDVNGDVRKRTAWQEVALLEHVQVIYGNTLGQNVSKFRPPLFYHMVYTLPIVRNSTYQAVWFLDEDLELDSLNTSAFLDRWLCAFPGGPPLVAQPTITPSTQAFWPLNHKTWHGHAAKMPLATTVHFVEQQSPIFDAEFWVWFMDMFGSAIASIMDYASGNAGADVIWCGAALSYRTLSMPDGALPQKNERPACAVIMEPIFHNDTNSIKKSIYYIMDSFAVHRWATQHHATLARGVGGLVLNSAWESDWIHGYKTSADRGLRSRLSKLLYSPERAVRSLQPRCHEQSPHNGVNT